MTGKLKVSKRFNKVWDFGVMPLYFFASQGIGLIALLYIFPRHCLIVKGLLSRNQGCHFCYCPRALGSRSPIISFFSHPINFCPNLTYMLRDQYQYVPISPHANLPWSPASESTVKLMKLFISTIRILGEKNYLKIWQHLYLFLPVASNGNDGQY